MKSTHDLKLLLAQCAEKSRGCRLTLQNVLDLLEDSAFCVLAILLAMPIMTPIPLGPFSTIGGITFVAMGWQLRRGETSPRLPAKVSNMVFEPVTWERIGTFFSRIIGLVDRFFHARHPVAWLEEGRGVRLYGNYLLAAGILMAIPCFGAPLNDALPAFAVFFASVAKLESNPRLLWVSAGFLLVSAIYISFLYYLYLTMGQKAFSYIQSVL